MVKMTTDKELIEEIKNTWVDAWGTIPYPIENKVELIIKETYRQAKEEERKRILEILRNLRVQYTLYDDEEIIGLLDDLKQEISKSEGKNDN